MHFCDVMQGRKMHEVKLGVVSSHADRENLLSKFLAMREEIGTERVVNY